jgi:hypothetical protein
MIHIYVRRKTREEKKREKKENEMVRGEQMRMESKEKRTNEDSKRSEGYDLVRMKRWKSIVGMELI